VRPLLPEGLPFTSIGGLTTACALLPSLDAAATAGNFSFALALVKHQPVTASLVLATAYDSRSVACEKYPDCAANVASLEALGARVLFSVDAADLERTPEVRSQPGGWTKVVWNFPHAGAGEKDQARNVAVNQALLLRFFRSVSPFLAKGPSRVAEVAKKGKGKGKGKERAAADDEDEDEGLDLDLGSDGEYDFDGRVDEEGEREARKGTILITLRNAEPYKQWSVLPSFWRAIPRSKYVALTAPGPRRNLPALLRKPPPPPPLSSLPPAQRPPPNTTLPPTQPRFALLRSFAFHASLYPGYAHRRTIGFQPGLSAEQNEEIDLRGGGRTVEAELVDESMFPHEDGTAEEREAKRAARREALREEKESKGRRRGNGYKDHRNREFKPPAAGSGWGRSNEDILASAVTSG